MADGRPIHVIVLAFLSVYSRKDRPPSLYPMVCVVSFYVILSLSLSLSLSFYSSIYLSYHSSLFPSIFSSILFSTQGIPFLLFCSLQPHSPPPPPPPPPPPTTTPTVTTAAGLGLVVYGLRVRSSLTAVSMVRGAALSR